MMDDLGLANFIGMGERLTGRDDFVLIGGNGEGVMGRVQNSLKTELPGR